jgi:S-adenosylmethionine synthetase
MRTAEAALEGHPDMLADIIADTIVDAFLAFDKTAKVGCEVLVGKNLVVIAGEFLSTADPDLVFLTRETIKEMGYVSNEQGFSANACEILTSVSPQSSPLAAVVDRSRGIQMGAGDQAVVIGYAEQNETGMIPIEMYYARKLANRLREVRVTNEMPYLWPDGKVLVVMQPNEDREPRLQTICISAQHDPAASVERMREDILQLVVRHCIFPKHIDGEFQVIVNPPNGVFSIGGPAADTGVTGRKCISSTYGPAVPHGGGALSGKDPSKIDRCGAYAARFLAKKLVQCGDAERVKVELTYLLGRTEPLAVAVFGWKRGQKKAFDLTSAATAEFDLRPAAVIERLSLNRPIYANSARFGHFGTVSDFPWEDVD